MLKSARCVIALCLALPLAACDSGKPAAAAADGKAEANAESKSDAAPHGKAAPGKKGAPTGAHGGATPPNPHGGMNPHGGGAKGGMPSPPKMGPPRDIKPGGEVVDETLAEFKVKVPAEWEKGQPRGPMRMAQWIIPGPGGDAELVVYRFKGGAGGVEANMKRWKGQFQPPEGKTVDDIGTVTKLTVGTLSMSKLDVGGHYVAAVRPGADQKHDEPEYRLLAAIVENSGDPLFLKAVGPEKTLGQWTESFDTMLQSVNTGG